MCLERWIRTQVTGVLEFELWIINHFENSKERFQIYFHLILVRHSMFTNRSRAGVTFIWCICITFQRASFSVPQWRMKPHPLRPDQHRMLEKQLVMNPEQNGRFTAVQSGCSVLKDWYLFEYSLFQRFRPSRSLVFQLSVILCSFGRSSREMRPSLVFRATHGLQSLFGSSQLHLFLSPQNHTKTKKIYKYIRMQLVFWCLH